MRVERVQPLMDSDFADIEVANCAYRAARHSDAMGESARADFAWALAIRQFELLNLEDRAEETRQEWAANRNG